MDVSHPAVHPAGLAPAAAAAGTEEAPPPPRIRMKDWQGMPGTVGGLTLRVAQFGFAVLSFMLMVSIKDFSTVTAFCYLVAATVLQSLWSFTLAIIDAYALLCKRSLRNSLLVSLFVIGDWVTATLTLAAACSSAGITVLIDNDLGECAPNHCGKYEVAVAMTFMTWFFIAMSFFFTFWLLATR